MEKVALCVFTIHRVAHWYILVSDWCILPQSVMGNRYNDAVLIEANTVRIVILIRTGLHHKTAT